MLKHPVSIYINWAAYDELSDVVELTEALALRQLRELLRLRSFGVRFDYYLMDAFWYARDGGYRAWRRPHWPNGPDAWLDQCLSNGVLPGLWLAGNSCLAHDPIPAWRDSLNEDNTACCLFSGGFFTHFLESLHLWHERGIRLFKVDFMNFDAAPPAIAQTMLPSEIRAQNIAAFIAGLKRFRLEHPGVVFLAYNGFEEQTRCRGASYVTQSNTSLPFRKVMDTRWLDVFDAIYCGDPRPADVPAMNFWRAKDVYSDHMVRAYALNGLPLARIDNSGFMIGTTGTCYYRGAAAWRGMLLLSLARGGWANTYYGNLDLLGEADARWFAKAQAMFMDLQAFGRCDAFGAMPGEGEPYGFVVAGADGALITVVNPSQRTATVDLGEALAAVSVSAPARLLFCDAGFEPTLSDRQVTLGAEQMALIGLGRYADAQYDLGVQDDVAIPSSIEPLAVEFVADGAKAITTTIPAPRDVYVRVVFRQTDARGIAKRTSGGSPPNGTTLAKLLTITAHRSGQEVPVRVNYDKAIWSGLSWAVGEIAPEHLAPGEPLTVRFESRESEAVQLTGAVYRVHYAREAQ